MNNILEIIKSAAIDSLIKNTIEEMHTMLNLEHEGGEEILKNFVKKGLSFGEKCKYVLLEKNGGESQTTFGSLHGLASGR